MRQTKQTRRERLKYPRDGFFETILVIFLNCEWKKNYNLFLRRRRGQDRREIDKTILRLGDGWLWNLDLDMCEVQPFVSYGKYVVIVIVLYFLVVLANIANTFPFT